MSRAAWSGRAGEYGPCLLVGVWKAGAVGVGVRVARCWVLRDRASCLALRGAGEGVGCLVVRGLRVWSVCCRLVPVVAGCWLRTVQWTRASYLCGFLLSF